MADFTTVGLLASIRRRAMLPTATATGTADADLLALANDELQLRLVADLLKVREEYFVHAVDQTIVATQTKYRIPSRAIGAALRDVEAVDSAGAVRKLDRIAPEAKENYLDGGTGTAGYYIQGNYVVLIPAADASLGTLRMTAAIRPAELTATAADYGTVTAINTSTKAVTYTGSASFTTSSVIDAVAARAPFDPLSIDQTPTAASAGSVTYDTLPVGLAVGDYLTTRDKSPVPQVPQEFHPILAQRVANTLMRALGDSEGLADGLVELERMEQDAGLLVETRTEGAPEKIINRNSLLRHGRGLGLFSGRLVP